MLHDETMTASECDLTDTSDHNEVDMDISHYEDVEDIEIQHGPETSKERERRLREKLKAKFSDLSNIAKENDVYSSHLKKDRVIVDVDILLLMFSNGCLLESCTGSSKVTNWNVEAGCLQLSWKCSNGHVGCWSSSQVLCNKGGADIYANSFLLAAGLLITGNNYDKLALFFKFLRLEFICRSTYNRMQRNYLIPEIKSFWYDMKSGIWETLQEEPTVLCGDGRNDSPGHNAKYCVYVLMEQFLEVIVDIEVVDKRETAGISTNMEVFGLKRLLERIVGNMLVSEVVTDASPAVIALVRKMKGNLKKVPYMCIWTSFRVMCSSNFFSNYHFILKLSTCGTSSFFTQFISKFALQLFLICSFQPTMEI